jgi:hypothetical protein
MCVLATVWLMWYARQLHIHLPKLHPQPLGRAQQTQTATEQTSAAQPSPQTEAPGIGTASSKAPPSLSPASRARKSPARRPFQTQPAPVSVPSSKAEAPQAPAAQSTAASGGAGSNLQVSSGVRGKVSADIFQALVSVVIDLTDSHRLWLDVVRSAHQATRVSDRLRRERSELVFPDIGSVSVLVSCCQ